MSPIDRIMLLLCRVGASSFVFMAVLELTGGNRRAASYLGFATWLVLAALTLRH